MNLKTTIHKIEHTTVTDLVALVALIFVGACSNGGADYRPDHGIPACEITHDMDSLFSSIFGGKEAPGGIVMVMRNDTIVYDHAWGLARLDKETPDYISDSTYFNLSSASKLFSATALLKLAEEGKLSLDDKLNKYFPEFSDSYLQDITIRNILTHSSGLPDLRPRNHEEWQQYLKDHESVFASGKDYRRYGSEEEHIKVFQHLDSVDFAPGTHYLRNDPAFTMVAPIIERVTGENYDSWMQTNIFAPAGVDGIYYFDISQDIHTSQAHGYRRFDEKDKAVGPLSKDGKWEEYDYGEAEFFLTKADRGAYASGRDFMKWINALYRSKIISRSSLNSMLYPYLHTDIPLVSFGLGFAMRIEPGFPLKAYHMNANGGFRSIEATWPDRKLHYIVFSNRNDWDERATAAAVDRIFRKHGWI